MSSDFTLMEEAGQFQSVVEKAEFSDHEGNALDCEEGIQKNLRMLEGLRGRGGNLFLVGNGGSAAVDPTPLFIPDVGFSFHKS